MNNFASSTWFFLMVCICSNSLADDRSYEATYSASFPDQMQSCTAAQAQAERLVRENFRSELTSDAYSLSIGNKHCDCQKSNRYATPLYECIGYTTGVLQAKASFNDDQCISLLTSNPTPNTYGMRMSNYLTCIRRLPSYNKTWDVESMRRVRDQQASELKN